ncbi:MAG: YopX family protein [Endozoicomonas sp.]
MSRVLKFRAWAPNQKKMFPLTQITFPGGESWSVGKGHGVNMEAQPHIEIMQFTGLKDSKGVEIYEGDICEHGTVVWDDGAFCLYVEGSNQGSTRLCQDRSRRWKVLGNIHQNPELLTPNG